MVRPEESPTMRASTATETSEFVLGPAKSSANRTVPGAGDGATIGDGATAGAYLIRKACMPSRSWIRRCCAIVTG